MRTNEKKKQGHIVTLEITSGQTYRGKLLEGTPKKTPLLPIPKNFHTGRKKREESY